MPLRHGTSNATRSANIAEMIRAGHPAPQAEAAAYRQQRESQHRSTHMDGVRQHKNMAGMDRGGNFGVELFHAVNGGREHPDRGMDSGAHMKDGERAIGGHVGRGRGKMPAQAHPDHGPHQAGAFGVAPLPR